MNIDWSDVQSSDPDGCSGWMTDCPHNGKFQGDDDPICAKCNAEALKEMNGAYAEQQRLKED